MAKQPKRRPPLIPERTIPPDVPTRCHLIRSLTQNIQATRQHLLTDAGWRNTRQRRALEALINQRGEVLALLPRDKRQELCTELRLTAEA